MLNRLFTPAFFSLLAISGTAAAQDQFYTSNSFTCFGTTGIANLRFIEAGDKVRLFWDKKETGAIYSDFYELLAEKTAGDLIFTRGSDPYLLVENYQSGTGVTAYRIDSDAQKEDSCDAITLNAAPPMIDAYSVYGDRISQPNMTGDQLISAVASKSNLWKREFLTRTEKREIASKISSSENDALESYLKSVEERLKTANGDVTASRDILNEVARVHANIDHQSFRGKLSESYIKGHDLVARMNFLDGKDPTVLAAPTAEAFCARLESRLGTSQGTTQLVRASGISMGFWTEELYEKYTNFSLECESGGTFRRILGNEQKNNERHKELREAKFAEFNRLMALPITLENMRKSNWLRLPKGNTKIAGYSLNENSLDWFSAGRLPDHRAKQIDTLRAELHAEIAEIGDMPLTKYRVSCGRLLGEFDRRNKMQVAVSKGCQSMLDENIEAEIARLVDLEPAASAKAAQEAGLADRSAGSVHMFCQKRTVMAPQFLGIDYDLTSKLLVACRTGVLENGASDLVLQYETQAKALLDEPRTLDSLMRLDWFLPASDPDMEKKRKKMPAAKSVTDALEKYRPQLKVAIAQAEANGLAELKALAKQAGTDAQAADKFQKLCKALPDRASDALSNECKGAMGQLRAQQATAECAPMWADTKKTDAMQKGTFIAPEIKGGNNAYVQSYFCRASGKGLTYEIIQDVGFFSAETYIAVTLKDDVDGLTAPAVMQAKIVPSELYDDVFELDEAKVTGQNGKTLAVSGSGMLLLACFTQPQICRFE